MSTLSTTTAATLTANDRNLALTLQAQAGGDILSELGLEQLAQITDPGALEEVYCRRLPGCVFLVTVPS